MRGLACALVLATSACPFLPDHDLAPGGVDTLIALPRDFEGFRAWPSFTVEGDGGDGHAAGTRTVYVSALVTDDGFGFETGSILVKAGLDETTEGERLHAMVKRGGGFNADGARNWEFFELTATSDDGVFIDWRGEDAPDGECYGLLPGQECTAALSSCNSCHVGAVGNDYVQSPPLKLGEIETRLLDP